MRRLLLAATLVAAGFATTTPASATHCEVEYKKICVSVCLTADVVYHAATGEHLACA
ncbi:MAG TPA: hypothetical protein VNA20_04410 [Frankiaceae bacterium]|nr:hypothetical protein [Frankiaceae bacterium]